MYRLVRDQPEQVLELEWKGVHPKLFFRGSYTFVGLPLIALAVAGIVTIARGEPNFGLLLALGPASFFILIPWASGLWMGYHHRIVFEKALTLSSKGPCLLLCWTRMIPFAEIRSLKLEVEEPKQIRLCLTYEPGRRLRGRTLQLQVEGLDRRDEAMDLVFRIGRIVEWQAYRVLPNDPRAMTVELFPSGEGTPIPAAAGPADYSKPHEVFHPAPTTIPSFDLDRLKGVTRFEVKAWEPGRWVHLAERPRTGPEWVGALIMGSLAALTVYLVLPKADWIWAPFAVACALGAAWGVYATRRREVELDWSAGMARFRRGRGVRTAPLGDIAEIVLRGRMSLEPSGGNPKYPQPSRPVYFCEMQAILPGADEVLLRTTTSREQDSPYLPTLAAAVELARALNIPWRWEPYR